MVVEIHACRWQNEKVVGFQSWGIMFGLIVLLYRNSENPVACHGDEGVCNVVGGADTSRFATCPDTPRQAAGSSSYFLMLLGDRLMVGHMPLEHSIMVRIHVPQQCQEISWK